MAAAIAASVLLSKFGFTPLTPLRTGLVSFLLAFFSLSHLSLKSSDLPLPVRRLSRGLAVIFGFILCSKYSSFPTDDVFLSLMTGPARWFFAALAAAAWWRPALLLPPVVFTGGWHLDALSAAGGIPLSHTDLNGLFTPSLVFCSGLPVLWRLTRYYEADAQNNTPWKVLMAVTIGVFFSNYFYSGVAKLALDGGPFSWWLENLTAALFLNTWDARQTPLSAWPGFCAWLYQFTAAAGPLINTAVLCIELLPLLAFFRWRWMAAAAWGARSCTPLFS